jgi:DNA modification methylase
MPDSVIAEFDLFGDRVRPRADAILRQRFIFPPFTVLSARDGDWQDRKRQWLSIGIQSELGRGGASDGMTSASVNAMRITGGHSARHGFDRESEKGLAFGAGLPARNGSGDGDGLTWRTSNLDAYRVNEGTRQSTQASGTSIFDPVLCELCYKWFSGPGMRVLDPFAGGSVRGIIASALLRLYTGIELRGEQVLANRAQAQLCTGPLPIWIHGDSHDVGMMAGANAADEFDFLFTCPPYADLERYSDDPRDLSTMRIDAFRTQYSYILQKCANRLASDSFACIVIGDVRGSDGNYYGLPGLTVEAFARASMPLYNEAILVTSVGSLPVRIGKQFNGSRKLGRTHQNVLVFLKGNAKRAAARCGILAQDETGSADE